MRDPSRIKPILEALESAWRSQPDTRLGQLLYNIATQENIDIFAIEDDRLLELLQPDPLAKFRVKRWKDKAELLNIGGIPVTSSYPESKITE